VDASTKFGSWIQLRRAPRRIYFLADRKPTSKIARVVFFYILSNVEEVEDQAETGIPITRVSVASDGTQGNDRSYYPAISADGRYVAFVSYASNLISTDTNGFRDIFVHDRQTGHTSRVSVASDGTQTNNDSFDVVISADGRYVVFVSYASNLVSDDTNGACDIFIHDRQTGQTSLISVASDGTQGDNDSLFHAISADGRYVAFGSEATNLVPGDTNGAWDIFVHDRGE